MKYLEEFGSATREEVNTLLWDKLPAHLDSNEAKKKDKIKNLLSSLRIEGLIKYVDGKWVKC